MMGLGYAAGPLDMRSRSNFQQLTILGDLDLDVLLPDSTVWHCFTTGI
jgi:hypothetical protein